VRSVTQRGSRRNVVGVGVDPRPDADGLVHLFQPYPADLMVMYPVSPLVNNAGNDSADLVVPVADATTL
jgi:putative SOS response-associated peptidase YedK